MAARTARPALGVGALEESAAAGAARYESLSALNPAHLKSLIGQEVVITLEDASTRRGTVYNVDPVNFCVALLKPRPPLIKGSRVPDSQHSSGTSPLCIVPGHAVKGVEIAGGGARALEALASSDPTARGSGRSRSLDLGSLLIRRDPPIHHPPHAAAGSFARGRTSPPLPSERANRRGLSAAFDAEAEAEASRAIEAGDRGGGGGRGTTDAKEDASASDDSAAMTASDARRLSARYRRVREALEAARVPVQEVAGGEGGVILGGAEDGGAGFGFGARDAPTLVVMGCVRISAPYTADACACANAVVLARVRAIVEEAAAGAA